MGLMISLFHKLLDTEVVIKPKENEKLMKEDIDDLESYYHQGRRYSF